MDNSSKKFLSCFLLALSLNRNACSMDKFLVSLMVPIITVGALALLPNPFSNKIPVNNLLSNEIPANNLYRDNCNCWNLNDLNYGDGWYTRGEIMDRYEEFIKNAMEDAKDLTENGMEVSNFPYEGLGMINKEKISNVAYASSVGCKISFDNSNNIKLNLYPVVSKLFENDLSNLPENAHFDNSSIAFKLLISNLNTKCREIFGEDFTPVEAENCRYDWKVSCEHGVLLKRNGAMYGTDEQFKEVKLTVYNERTNNDNKKITPKRITAVFIVELKRER